MFCWAGINLDISRLKRTEERLKASLREKEVLLPEIHHRVRIKLREYGIPAGFMYTLLGSRRLESVRVYGQEQPAEGCRRDPLWTSRRVKRPPMYLSRKRFLTALSLVLLGVAVYLAIDLNRSGRREVLRQYNTLQSLLARQAVHEVASYLDRCADDLLAVAERTSVQRQDLPRMVAVINGYYETGEHFPPMSVTLLNPQGEAIYSTGGTAVAPDLAGSEVLEWARKPENRGKVFVSSWAGMPKEQFDRLGGGRVLLATPVYGPSPNSAAGPTNRIWSGVLLATVDFESILTEHLSALAPQPRSHRVWIMDHDGTILLQSEHPEMARENIYRAGPQCAQCHVSFDYARNMLQGRAGVTEYQLKAQPRKLAAFAPLQFANASWIVVVNAPYADVTAFVHRNYTRMLLLLGFILAALGLASVVLHQSEVSKVRAEVEARQWQEKHGLEEKLRRSTEELHAALASLKTLRGLLPICAHCKQIRDDHGYWHQVELYIQEHADVRFTHGVCPDCRRKFYPEIYPSSDSG